MFRMLKPTSLLPPVIALAIAGTWLGSQHRSISTLEKESAVLRKAIAARSATSSAGDSPSGRPASAAKAAKDKEPLDWKKIAAQFDEMRQSGGMGDMRTMMKFQQRLQAMTQEELVAAFDEIGSLDLPTESRQMLEQMLLGPLVQKDPELALTKFIDRIQSDEGGMSWQLASAMQEWAKKDLSAAIAWFDRQIAAGKFDSKSLDGKSRNRLQFEGGLINVLLGSDPDAAGRRLAAMPEDQRDETLSQFSFHQLKEDDQLAFAKLVRDQVPEKKQAEALAQQASRMVENDDYSKVTGFLDRINATPAERTVCVVEAAESGIRSISHRKKITREDLDTMRAWVATQAPESTGSVTGKALANASQGSRKMEFSEAAALADEYNTAAGNDEVLSAFLDGWPARQNKDQARVLAEKISDGKRREEILKKLK
jgi:hypothetical protein